MPKDSEGYANWDRARIAKEHTQRADIGIYCIRQVLVNIRDGIMITYYTCSTGVYIKLIAASFPQGYVCRISDLSGWLQYPTCETDMVKKLTPIIQLVWHAKTTMTQVVDMVQMDEDTVDLSKKRSTIPIPPSFTPSSSSKSSPTNGKRSRNDLSST